MLMILGQILHGLFSNATNSSLSITVIVGSLYIILKQRTTIKKDGLIKAVDFLISAARELALEKQQYFNDITAIGVVAENLVESGVQ